MLAFALVLLIPGHPGPPGPSGPLFEPRTARAPLAEIDLPARVSGQDIDLKEERARLDLAFRTGLEEISRWCTKKRNFAARAEIYLELIRIDPEHEEARRGLGHTKDRQGEWHENESKIPPVNWTKKALPEFEKRLDQVRTDYLDGMFAVLEQHRDQLTEKQVTEWKQVLLETSGEDPRIRKMRGEVKLEDRWVLSETADAKLRRAAIREMVRKAIESAPQVTPTLPTDEESTLGVEWKYARRSELVRCLGTCDESEVVRMADATYALREVFNRSFATEANYPEDFAVYLLAREGEKGSFLGAHPSITDSQRQFLVNLEGAVIEDAWDIAQWADKRPRRLDGAVRLESALLLASAFDCRSNHGWILEGFGLYFTRELLGTRLTWFASPSEYHQPKDDKALQQRLLAPDANWMAEANKVLQAPRRPRLEFLLGKGVNQLSAPDLLYAYVLASFLLEARADVVNPILTQIGKGEPPEKVFLEHLELDLPGLDERVRRWLTERK